MATSKEIRALMKEFNIPFSPSKITGAKKSKKWVDWEAMDDAGLSRWKALYAIWQPLSVVERKRIEAIYSFTPTTLKKRVGGVNTRANQPIKFIEHETGIEVRTLNIRGAAVLADMEAKLAQKKDDVKKLEAQIKKMKSLDEDTMQAIVESLQGIG